MESTPPTRRRWSRFSLRTLLVVVTLFALWLGWELKIVRERKAVLEWVKANKGATWFAKYGTATTMKMKPAPKFHNPKAVDVAPRIPFWRSWLGDEAVYCFELPFPEEAGSRERVLRSFPEAQIWEQNEHGWLKSEP